MVPATLPRPASGPARRSALGSTGLAVTLLLALTGCTPPAAPEPSDSLAASASASAEPSPSAAPGLALPDCDSMFSPDLVAALTADGREPEAATIGPYSNDAGVVAVFGSVTDLVSCDWILPASESGSTTTVALIDDATAGALEIALADGGFSGDAYGDGRLYTITVEGELVSSTEAHLIVDGAWISTTYFGGDAEALTLDAAGQLLP